MVCLVYLRPLAITWRKESAKLCHIAPSFTEVKSNVFMRYYIKSHKQSTDKVANSNGYKSVATFPDVGVGVVPGPHVYHLILLIFW